jgi:hypothetical protein
MLKMDCPAKRKKDLLKPGKTQKGKEPKSFTFLRPYRTGTKFLIPYVLVRPKQLASSFL